MIDKQKKKVFRPPVKNPFSCFKQSFKTDY